MTPKRILVIGGGPAGLVSLRNLTDRGQFEHVELVERRDDVGGVWYLDDPKEGDTKPRWPSPAYPGLVGNVLPEFLSFSHFPFPEPPSTPHQPFPTLSETYDYLRAFADPYLKSGHIRLNTEITSVDELPDGAGWKVTFNDWNVGGESRQETWDAVVVAVGWYDNLVWPETEGLDELRAKNLAIHAKWWRGAKGYEGKVCSYKLRIAMSNHQSARSGYRECQFLQRYCRPASAHRQDPVYRSIRRPAFPGFPSLPNEHIKDVAPVTKYSLGPDDKITATLKDGTIISDIDTVFIGTGYEPYPKYVHLLNENKELQSLMTPPPTPHRIPSLHRYILNAHNPSLAFICSTMCYTPFTIGDLQSTWLALAWRGEIVYPQTAEERLVFERDRLKAIADWVATLDNPSALFVYGVLGAYEEEYAIALKEDVVKACPELKDVLPEWSEARTKHRETMYPVKFKSLEWMRDQSKVKN
ncbi:FAD/NAD(P)-binding domain-containing protein [Hymenopellis radicata]|nr:FAD/NAD(P)-binding domain-containing protein [Hymenopellis radicata]